MLDGSIEFVKGHMLKKFHKLIFKYEGWCN